MDLKKAENAIRGAWIAGIISGSLTLLVTLLGIAGVRIFNFNAWTLLDVILVYGLTFGIYKKNRVCAVVMFVYFIVSKLYLFVTFGAVTGLPVAILFGYFFFQGIRGTFAYHTLTNGAPSAPATPRMPS